MSLWIRRRDADGKLHQYAIPFDPMAFVAIVGILMGLTLSFVIAFRELAATRPLQTACVLAIAIALGFAMFATAKFSVMRRGVLFSFGPARMTRSMQRLYFAGYALIAGSALLVLIFSA